MGKKQTFDFRPKNKTDRAAAEQSKRRSSSEFFIDGWDAYDEWLRDLRQRLQDGRHASD